MQKLKVTIIRFLNAATTHKILQKIPKINQETDKLLFENVKKFIFQRGIQTIKSVIEYKWEFPLKFIIFKSQTQK